MASILPLVKLVELGYELCGSYSLPANAGEALKPHFLGRGFSIGQPLTCRKRLDTFIARMPGFRGRKKAMHALGFIAENSASPMETKLTMLLTFPFMLGGYGFPLPELNSRITPIRSAKLLTSKSFYACDLYWPDFNLAVEYDSDRFHTGPERISDDSKRRNSLTVVGVEVITVTWEQVRNTNELDKIAQSIGKGMERRLQPRDPSFPDKRRKLRDLLL